MQNKKKPRSSKWNWYGVKLLYECVISGEPTIETIDENYNSDHKTYEESIIAVKAQSFEHAYKIAEKKATEAEIAYSNPYDERVEWRFVRSLDAFQMFDDNIKSGTEVYSRFLRVSKNISVNDVISAHYPETVQDDDVKPDYNYILRIREFNARPNSSNNDSLKGEN